MVAPLIFHPRVYPDDRKVSTVYPGGSPVHAVLIVELLRGPVGVHSDSLGPPVLSCACSTALGVPAGNGVGHVHLTGGEGGTEWAKNGQPGAEMETPVYLFLTHPLTFFSLNPLM